MKSFIETYRFAFDMVSYKRFTGVLFLFVNMTYSLSALVFPYLAGMFFQNLEKITEKTSNIRDLLFDNTLQAIVTFSILYLLIQLAFNILSARICVKIEENIYVKVFQRLFNAKLPDIEKFSIGDIQIRFGELDKICDYARLFLGVLVDIVVILSCSIYLLYISPYLLALAFIFLLNLFFSELVKRKLRKYIVAHRTAGAELTSKYTYNISMYKDIFNLHANGRIVSDTIKTYGRFLDVLWAKFKFMVKTEFFRGLLTYSIFATVGLCIVFLIQKEFIGIHEAASFALLLNILKGSMQSIGEQLEKRNELELQRSYYKGFMDLDVCDETMQDREIDSIRIQNLSFSYDKKQQVLERFSMFLDKEHIHIFKGPNGCGKSTLYGLINRSLDPDIGAIKVSEKHNISRKDSVMIRADNHHFYTGEIVKDICLITGKAEREVNKLLEYFDLDVAKLSENPKKNGAQLSTGQKKILAVIRGFLLKPRILLLDEPFANLSDGNIKNLVRYIENISGIVCIISHDIPEIITRSPRFKIHNFNKLNTTVSAQTN